MDEHARRRRVVIIGAGFGGLRAAHVLRRAGADVLGVQAAGRQVDLRAGQVVALDIDVTHIVTARSDCTILITMSID